MNVTALFAEILTVGVQTLCWIALGLLAFGVIDVSELTWRDAADWSALLATVFLALTYTAGVIVDRVADDVATRWFKSETGEDKETRKAASARRNYKLAKWGVKFADVRLRVYQGGAGILGYLEYQRSRIRIARATMLNLIPTALFGAVAAWHFAWSLLILAIGALCFRVVREVWLSISDTYEERLLQAFELLEPEKVKPKENKPAPKKRTTRPRKSRGKKKASK